MDAGGDDHRLPFDAANLGVDVDVPADDGWMDEAIGDGAEEPSKSLPDPQTEDQLIITFQGAVHVFNGVSQRRVEAVLYLLSENETSADITSMRPVPDLNSKDSDEASQSESSANAYRQEALMRYREKKKRRNSMNRVKYQSRQEAASRMRRHKGQFVSSRANVDAEGNPSIGNNAQEETYPVFCQNCMISKDETPLMRRGPNGPRSLCNPCGLKWAHTGMLRIPPQGPSSMSKDLQANKIEQDMAQIPPEVPSLVGEDFQVNKIDQIDNNDIKVLDAVITDSAETRQAGNDN